MGPPSYMRSFVDLNVLMRRIPVTLMWLKSCLLIAWYGKF